MRRKTSLEDKQKIELTLQDYESIPEKRMVAFNRMYTRQMLDLASHKLVPANKADQEIGLKNKLALKNPFDIGGKKSDSIRAVGISKLIARILFFFLFTYCAFYTFLVAICQYRHDLVLNDWQPLVRANAIQTTKCALKDDIHFATQTAVGEASIKDKLIEAKSMLKNVGAPAPSLTGVTTIWLGALCIIPVLLAYIILYVVYMYDIRIDALSYNFDIVKEKKRLHRDLCQIIDCMIHSTDYRIEFRDGKLQIIQNDDPEIPLLLLSPSSDGETNYNQATINLKRKSYLLEIKEAELFEADLIFKQYQEYHLSNLNINSIRASNRGEAKLLFIKTLLNPNILKMAEPSLLNLKWYRIMIFISFVYRIFVLITGTMCIFAMIFYFMIGENYYRAKFRLEQIECSKWHPNGTVIMDTFQLNELPLEEDMKSYLDYDGSFKNLLKLALFVEFKYYCRSEVIISCFCLLLTLLPSLLVTTQNLTIYVQSFVDKAVWSYEINNHIDKCLEIMTRHKILMKSSSIIGDKLIESSENEIMVALVVSYLKYELFRRQQSHYNLVTYSCLLIVAVFMTLALILCFFVGTTLRNCLNSFVLGSATFAMTFGDFFLLTVAIRTSQSEHFMRKVTTLLARTTSIDIELWHIRKLWARQLLSENDIKQLFTPTFFTFSVSKKNVLAANGYIVAFWWIYLNTRR